MFLFGNKFYVIFISIWIIGLYLVFSTFRFTSSTDKVSEERIEYLQNEVDSLRQKILHIQSGKEDAPQLPRFVDNQADRLICAMH